MTIHGYEVDMTKGFTCTRRNKSVTFKTHEEAVAFIQKNYGYMITYHIVKPIEEEKTE